MHSHSIESWSHDHVFLGGQHAGNERKVWVVVALTVTMMIVEITGGTIFGSLALVVDGWHMSTHAAALAISAAAYLYARRHAQDERFAFGTGKLGDLAAFTSAIVLAMIALLIGYESIMRLIAPVPIAFGEAIGIAVLSLLVNVASAWLLKDDHHHAREHAHHPDDEHAPHHDHHHAHDHNLRAAYVHVLADAATSVLAILGLSAAALFGWAFMDPIVGLIGTIVILSWAYGLVRAAGSVLLDVVPDAKLARTLRKRLERDGDRVADLHLWRVGPGHNAAIVSIVSDHPKAAAEYRERIASLPGLSHITVQVEECPHDVAA
jgi:cation diffusion facilitator family transporter